MVKKDMRYIEGELINDIQLLCREAYDMVEDNDITIKNVEALATRFNRMVRDLHGKQGISDLVKEWVAQADGEFSTGQIHIELGLKTRDDKKVANMALVRLKEDDVITKSNNKRGYYRPVEPAPSELDWEAADPDAEVPIHWPLGLERAVRILPKNVVIVAGEKNCGKTAFALETAYLNSGNGFPLPVKYYSSEMGAQELGERIRKFPSTEPFKTVKFFPIADNIHDHVDPNALNIYDFMEVYDEFWKVGSIIRKVYDKLDQGIALILLQKKEGEKLGRGGDFSGEKSRAYFVLTPGKLLIKVAKNWRGEKNPNGKTLQFRLENSSIFVPPEVSQ